MTEVIYLATNLVSRMGIFQPGDTLTFELFVPQYNIFNNSINLFWGTFITEGIQFILVYTNLRHILRS